MRPIAGASRAFGGLHHAHAFPTASGGDPAPRRQKNQSAAIKEVSNMGKNLGLVGAIDIANIATNGMTTADVAAALARARLGCAGIWWCASTMRCSALGPHPMWRPGLHMAQKSFEGNGTVVLSSRADRIPVQR